jgi:hypothetical protein
MVISQGPADEFGRNPIVSELGQHRLAPGTCSVPTDSARSLANDTISYECGHGLGVHF